VKNKFDKETLAKIKNILLKKAEGYFYNEEVLEYAYKNESESKTEQLDFLKEQKRKNGKTQENTNLILTKKKVTTHYIPPDLLAIKMLTEIYGEKIEGNDLSKLSDTDLLILKEDIINKLKSN